MDRSFTRTDIGISAIEVYFPKTYVSQSKREAHYEVWSGKYTLGLGQDRMSFVTEAEDSCSMALTCMDNLLKTKGISPKDIGRLEIGTETIHDHSKSIKTDMMSYFKKYDNMDIEGVTTYNACYGGTAALFNT